MQNFVVIGLGNFGLNVAMTLMENDCEVLGIDKDKANVQRAMENLSHAIIGDASDRAVLRALEVKDFDGAVVSIGQELTASILISLYLKELGIKRIVVRAISEDHVKVLEKLGVSDIIFPEKDMAVRLGKLLSMKNTFDYLALDDEYVILEVTTPKPFIGKTLRGLQIMSRYNCQILGVKYPDPGANVIGKDEPHKTRMAPAADDIIPDNSILIVLGKQEDIEKLQQGD